MTPRRPVTIVVQGPANSTYVLPCVHPSRTCYHSHPSVDRPTTSYKEYALKRLICCCVAATLLVGCAKDDKQAAAAGPKPSRFQEQKQTVTATVDAVDPKTRMVTLRGENGESVTF